MERPAIDSWWSPREDIRFALSMRVTAVEGGVVYLETPLWNGHVLSWETSVVELLGKWVEVE